MPYESHSPRVVLALCLGLSVLCQANAAEGKRIALLIGNAAYADAPLRCPVNDARTFGASLEKCGFDVTVASDCDGTTIVGHVKEFADRLEPDSAGLFYFSGHGLSVEGKNCLVAIGDGPRYVPVEDILNYIEKAGNLTNIVVFDACRSVPRQKDLQAPVHSPFGSMKAPSGSLLAFATGPGTTASDGPEGGLSLYTKALVAHVATENVPVEEMFKSVREQVMKESGDRQVPWEHSSLVGDFYFRAEGAARRARSDGETVVRVMGTAPADSPNREQVAKREAMLNAMRKVVGVQVRAHTYTANHALIEKAIYARTDGGFIKEVRGAGPPTIAGGVFIQEYEVTVAVADVNRALLEQEVDVEFLYDVVRRPRVAVVIGQTLTVGSEQQRRSDQTTHNAIVDFFKTKHPGFDFRNLRLLTDSIREEVDWVQLARKHHYDVLIQGEVKLSETRAVKQQMAGHELTHYVYSSEVDWSVSDTASARLLCTIHESAEPVVPMSGKPYPHLARPSAQAFARDTVVADALPKLFRKLMRHWLQSFRRTPYDMVFSDCVASEADDVVRRLNGLVSLVPDSSVFAGCSDGALTVRTLASGTLNEVLKELAGTFPQFESDDAATGRISLRRKRTTEREPILIRVAGVSFRQRRDLHAWLTKRQGIRDVDRGGFQNGTAELRVKTSKDTDSIALELEEFDGLKVTGIDGRVIEAAVDDDGER